MRLLLTLVAIVAMFVSPALAGTKTGCPMGAGGAATVGAMAKMDMAVGMNAAAHRCCDPSSKQKSTHNRCAQMCAALGVVAIAVDHLTVDGPSAFATLAMPMPNAASLRAFEPLGLKRPPKPVA